MSTESTRIDIRERRRPRANRRLDHIPGEDGLPWLGQAVEFLKNPRAMSRRMRERYGPVYRTAFVGQRGVALSGADALEHVLLNRDRNFSSELGWNHALGRLFSRGLMLMDFDEHRIHRRIMNAAFGREALGHYIESMNAVAAAGIEPWIEERDFRFYPALKQLTLDNAAVAFLGLELGPEANRINEAFVDTVAASVAFLRIPVPGFAFQRGLSGRRLLSDFFADQIPARRGSEGRDMFTRLCNATNDDGVSFTDQDIVDHMIFLMMAAHDTVTSTLTTSVYALAAHPAWQSRLREEARAAGTGPLAYADLDRLPQTERVFNEAMRLYAPVPYIPRRALREFEWRGFTIPANTQVTVSPDSAHHDPAIWSDPGRFDPERFAPERAEHKRHAFGYVPYGGGAHKCLGMHFANILAKVFLHRFVLSYEFSVADGYVYDVQQMPIPKPRDGLPLRLRALDD
jgi:cytochrome P450